MNSWWEIWSWVSRQSTGATVVVIVVLAAVIGDLAKDELKKWLGDALKFIVEVARTEPIYVLASVVVVALALSVKSWPTLVGLAGLGAVLALRRFHKPLAQTPVWRFQLDHLLLGLVVVAIGACQLGYYVYERTIYRYLADNETIAVVIATGEDDSLQVKSSSVESYVQAAFKGQSVEVLPDLDVTADDIWSTFSNRDARAPGPESIPSLVGFQKQYHKPISIEVVTTSSEIGGLYHWLDVSHHVLGPNGEWDDSPTLTRIESGGGSTQRYLVDLVASVVVVDDIIRASQRKAVKIRQDKVWQTLGGDFDQLIREVTASDLPNDAVINGVASSRTVCADSSCVHHIVDVLSKFGVGASEVAANEEGARALESTVAATLPQLPNP